VIQLPTKFYIPQFLGFITCDQQTGIYTKSKPEATQNPNRKPHKIQTGSYSKSKPEASQNPNRKLHKIQTGSYTKSKPEATKSKPMLFS